MATSNSSYLAELHQRLNQHFNLAELRTLCLHLNVDYESVPGAEKPSIIRELLLALARLDRLPELLELLQRERPRVDWLPVPDDFQLPASLATGSTAVPTHQYHVYGDVVHGDEFGGDKITVEAGATAVFQGPTLEEVAALIVEFKHENQPKVWDGRIPYPGLHAFQKSDAPFFFGRKSLVAELLERVRQARFITIAGPSGSGKSSLARAGLFHALDQGRLERSDTWLLAAMQPKGNPIEQLAGAFDRLAKSPMGGDHIRRQGLINPLALHQQVETLLTDDLRQRCVLLVDQFEEIFTQTKHAHVRSAFIALLTTAAQTEPGRTIIVLALRSDFVSHCAPYPELRALISQQFQLVGAMEPRDLIKAITLPALEVGVEIDPALASQIVTDMKGEPGTLPLMSFALRDLFDAEKTKKGKPMTLSQSNYLARGGIDSALERHANKVFAGFTAEEKALARNIFSRLIEVGEEPAKDTRRTASLRELVPADAGAKVIMDLIEKLAQKGARLIITSGLHDDQEEKSESEASVTVTPEEAKPSPATGPDGDRKMRPEEMAQVTVTLAHEKLIEAWPWLRRLVDENRDVIALRNQISNDARDWEREKDDGFLFRGGRLLQVKEKLSQLQPDLDDLSRRFIQASIAAEKKRQRTRRFLLIGGTVALAVLLMLSIGAALINRERNDAIAAQQTAVAAQATSDVNAALANFEAVEADTARSTAEAAAITESEARSTAVAAQGTAQADANRANIAEATAVAAEAQAEQQRKIMSLLAQSQALMNVRAPDNEAVAQARLMAVAAMQIDQEATGGQNQPLLTQWNYDLTRILTAPYQPLMTLTDRTALVSSVAWNAAGSRLASASRDGTITIWQADENQPSSWQPLTTLNGHTARVHSVAWNPDGSRLASASYDATIIIWDTTDWQPLITLTEHEQPVHSVAWNGAGSRLASASYASIIIWQADENEPNPWQPLASLTDHTSWVLSVAWNAAGSRLASASSDSNIIIWQADESQPNSWQPLATLTNHAGTVNSVTWNANGSRLASASADNSIIIWDTIGWQPQATLTDHTGTVLSIAWDGDGSRLASASADATVIIWQVDENEPNNWQPLATLTDQAVGFESVAWNGDGSRLASASCASIGDISGICTQSKLSIWDTVSWQPLTTLADHASAVTSLAWNPDGSRLASASSDSNIVIWDTTSWQPLATLTGHAGTVNSVAWNADSSRLASASSDSNIIIWDTASWQPLATLFNHAAQVFSVAWNADGSRLASASGDRSVIIWQTDENQPGLWQPFTVFTGHRSAVFDVAWNEDGSFIATASDDGSIFIWHTAIWWEPRTVLFNHAASVFSVAWNEDGSRLASAAGDGATIIWDTASWQPMITFAGRRSPVFGLAWNPDGNRLASTSGTNVVIWDTASWQPLTTLTDHTSRVLSVAWNDDGSRLVSASTDKTIIITVYEDSSDRNCDLARRNFSWDEWQQIFPTEPYRVICTQWPVHPSVPPEARPEM